MVIPTPAVLSAATVAARRRVIEERIERAGGDPDSVRIVAVTKGFGVEAVMAAREAGLSEVGENYARELTAKRRALEETGSGRRLRWDFLGAIQTNKIRALAPLVDCWQSVSREVEGERIAAARPGADVLVQVAFATDAGRPGCEPGDVGSLVGALAELGLAVRGLMVVAPRPPEEARSAFRRVRALADDLGLEIRSMGMTEDLELAVAEGSTMVRIGRALFGERPIRDRAP